MSMQPLLIPESAGYLRNPAVTWLSVFGGLGRRFAFRGVKEQWTIIGVIGDSKLDAWRDGPYPELYIAHRSGRNLSGVVWFALRTSGDPLDIASHAATE